MAYGTQELNPLNVNGTEYHGQYSPFDRVQWDNPDLKEVTRLRLLSDPGFPVWDVSYVYGEMKDGTKVHVEVPFSQLPKHGFQKAIVQAAIRDGIHAKNLGVLAAISTLC